jgi:hypothetical protein
MKNNTHMGDKNILFIEFLTGRIINNQLDGNFEVFAETIS